MDKSWFILQYNEIHDNLYHLERQIEIHQCDPFNIAKNPSLLMDLKEKVSKEILRLNKTREHERRIFGYETPK
jgi:hypothetical protein